MFDFNSDLAFFYFITTYYQFSVLLGLIPAPCIVKSDQWIMLTRTHAEAVITLTDQFRGNLLQLFNKVKFHFFVTTVAVFQYLLDYLQFSVVFLLFVFASQKLLLCLIITFTVIYFIFFIFLIFFIFFIITVIIVISNRIIFIVIILISDWAPYLYLFLYLFLFLFLFLYSQ